MDPHDQFCHNPDCFDRGQSGLGNICIHSRKEQRYCCSTCARSLALLVCVDGLASYVTAFLRVFRDPVRMGRRGRPRLVTEPGLLIGQVIKRYAQRRVVKVVHRVVCGTATAIAKVLKATGGTVINNLWYLEAVK